MAKKLDRPKSKSLAILSEMEYQHRYTKCPDIPERVRFHEKYDDRTANELTNVIVLFLKLKGWLVEPIITTGKRIDNTKVVTDVLGHRKTIGSVTWVKGRGKNGSADISSTIQGKSIKIEIKMRDKQSEAQKQYQQITENSGGIYLIFTSFDDFHEWYLTFITN